MCIGLDFFRQGQTHVSICNLEIGLGGQKQEGALYLCNQEVRNIWKGGKKGALFCGSKR